MAVPGFRLSYDVIRVAHNPQHKHVEVRSRVMIPHQVAGTVKRSMLHSISGYKMVEMIDGIGYVPHDIIQRYPDSSI